MTFLNYLTFSILSFSVDVALWVEPQSTHLMPVSPRGQGRRFLICYRGFNSFCGCHKSFLYHNYQVGRGPKRIGRLYRLCCVMRKIYRMALCAQHMVTPQHSDRRDSVRRVSLDPKCSQPEGYQAVPANQVGRYHIGILTVMRNR